MLQELGFKEWWENSGGLEHRSDIIWFTFLKDQILLLFFTFQMEKVEQVWLIYWVDEGMWQKVRSHSYLVVVYTDKNAIEGNCNKSKLQMELDSASLPLIIYPTDILYLCKMT